MLIALVATTLPLRAEDAPRPLVWPQAVMEAGPWTRWWWLGSAVDKAGITRQLEQFKAAGIRGVEICPIYGAKGYEDRYIDFLSDKWVEMLKHTVQEGRRLGVGVDMTTGTGWPFGGPGVSERMASSRVVIRKYQVGANRRLEVTLPEGRIVSVGAVDSEGNRWELTGDVKDRGLKLAAAPHSYTIYAVMEVGPVQKVKRAAPGGEGNVLDPFSAYSMSRYLERFDKAGGMATRAQFHDSYEYYNASWTPEFLDQFEARKHYSLRRHVSELAGDGAEDQVARVKHDYRQTISELHESYVQAWTDWAHQRGQKTREQAHGAPANLLDVYAVADIPETELQFGDVNERQIPMLKMASSAAHVMHKPLSSSESFTWLGEHFQVSLADVKPAADLFLLSGVNHIFFHGIPYSPEDVKWPGWLFYAAVNFGPNGGIWHDLPAFNAYVARCQWEMRLGEPDEDVVVYFPVHDIWETSKGMLIPMGVGDQNKWFWDQSVYKTATGLWKSGVGFDFVSDTQVRAGRKDQVIVVPPCRYMPAGTVVDLMGVARDGGTVVFEGGLPEDVPGLSRLDEERARFQKALAEVAQVKDGGSVAVGKGTVFVGGDLMKVLGQTRVHREPMAEMGLRLVRRKSDWGRSYFVVNRGEKAVDGWVPLGTDAKSVAILDPRFEGRGGFGAVRRNEDGRVEVYLQMQPGESRVLRTFAEKKSGRDWEYAKVSGQGRAIEGEWTIEFVEGGPKLPGKIRTAKLDSWTKLGGEDAKVFGGAARYTTEFDEPVGEVDDWVLRLGKVCESARVKLNGQELGTLWCAPSEISVGKALRHGKNLLEIEVTNVAANRIADLDRRHVDWKSFHEINFVNRNYKPFDASGWPLRDSGLMGPVELVPVKSFKP
jgi:hypothetical protein